MAGPEKRVEAALDREVRKIGGLTYKWAPTRSGLPDRIVVLPGGRIEFVELKAKGGTISDLQRSVHDQLAQRGAAVHVVWSVEQAKALVAGWSADVL